LLSLKIKEKLVVMLNILIYFILPELKRRIDETDEKIIQNINDSKKIIKIS